MDIDRYTNNSKAAFVLFLSTFVMRLLPAILIAILNIKGVINIGQPDSIVYLKGAQAIAASAINPFIFFPPLNFLFISFFIYLGNNNIFFAVFAMAALGWMTVLLIYYLCNQIYGNRIAFLASILCCAYPNLAFFSLTFHSETLAIFFIVLTFIFLLNYFLKHDLFFLIGAGFFWGLASQTRGGLHFFSIVIALFLIYKLRYSPWTFILKTVLSLLAPVYATILMVGFIVSPVHKNAGINSGSGIGSFIHGCNRITTSCPDYGDIRGNIFYDINSAKDDWPPNSQLFNEDILQHKIWDVALKILLFIKQDPLAFILSSLRKLSCFWSPNQHIIAYINIKYSYSHNFITSLVSALLCLTYIFIICFGLLGLYYARDPLKPIFILFILYYCLMIFFTVGNSKLRLPLIPFFILYSAFFIVHLINSKASFKASLIKLISHKSFIILMILFLSNSVFKYREITLSPGEIITQRIELCQKLGFYKTAQKLIDQCISYPHFSNLQKTRIDTISIKIKQLQHN